MKENKEYKNEALAALKGRWAPSVLAVLAIWLFWQFSSLLMR